MFSDPLQQKPTQARWHQPCLPDRVIYKRPSDVIPIENPKRTQTLLVAAQAFVVPETPADGRASPSGSLTSSCAEAELLLETLSLLATSLLDLH